MARASTIEISGLNIVSQPHNPEQYVQIFDFIKDNRFAIPVVGNDRIVLVQISYLNEKKTTDGIVGKILKYSHIDNDSTWVNVDIGDELDGNDLPRIPKDVHLNGVFYDFIFYPKSESNVSHKLFFISRWRDSIKQKTRTLSPNYLKRYFETVFQHTHFQTKFNSIEVTVIPDSNALDEIFSLETINRLDLEIKTPNPDIFSDDFEENTLNRHKAMNISKVHETYFFDGDSINPDDTLKARAKVAQNNGYVKATGANSQGDKQVLSTIDIPMKFSQKVDSDKVDSIKIALRSFINIFRNIF